VVEDASRNDMYCNRRTAIYCTCPDDLEGTRQVIRDLKIIIHCAVSSERHISCILASPSSRGWVMQNFNFLRTYIKGSACPTLDIILTSHLPRTPLPLLVTPLNFQDVFLLRLCSCNTSIPRRGRSRPELRTQCTFYSFVKAFDSL
jgi:hypothetical protein